MSAPFERVVYAGRRAGGDQDRYEPATLAARPGPTWPGGATVAVWVVVSIECFRFDGAGSPFRPRGAPSLEYPDYWGHSQRDYGNRIGVFRLLDLFERHGVRGSAALNSEVCTRHPYVVEAAFDRGLEPIAQGRSASETLHEGLSEADEREIVSESLETIGRATGGPVRGWLSPSLSESSRTLDLLAAASVEYVCDWVNDDLPYRLRTDAGALFSLPYALELNDLTVMHELHQRPAEFRDQIVDQFRILREEAADHGGRVLCIALHPWIAGVPHRIRYVEDALATVLGSEQAWPATGGEILDAFRRWSETRDRD